MDHQKLKAFTDMDGDDAEKIGLAAVGKEFSIHAIEPDHGAVNIYFKREDSIYLLQIHQNWNMMFCDEETSTAEPYNPISVTNKLRELRYKPN